MQILPMTAAAVAARAGAGTGVALLKQAGGFAGQLLRAAGAGSPGDQQTEHAAAARGAGSANSGAITLAGLQQRLQAVLHSSHADFVALLEQAGVTPDPPVELQLDESTGELTVPRNHPHRTQIETVLAEQPELANRFRHAMALESLLQAARKLQPMNQADSTDAAAVARAEAHHVTVVIDRNAARMSAVPDFL